MAVALLVFGVYDLRLGLSLRTILFFQLPDAIETLTAAFGLRYAFGAIMGLGSTSPSIKIPTSRSTLQGFNRLAQIHLALRVRLQFRGVSKPETLNLTLSGKGTGHGHIAGTMAFDRKEFGMNSNFFHQNRGPG